MSHLKPIEPGCLCVVIKSKIPQQIGSIWTAIGLMNAGNEYKGHKLRDPTGKPGWIIENGNDWKWYNKESLMRIDGYEDDKEITEIAKELS